MNNGSAVRIHNIRTFHTVLLDWYRRHCRDLPWRRTRDPYRIWLSEIMLQQTRVATVTERYERFLKRFPTVQKLAAARESSVLAQWSGLGYYRRARNLHVAARKTVNELAGNFPDTSEELRKLPGIGRYTAAAIASIAFNEPIAVVDGNVERVISRLLGTPGISEKQLWNAAERLLSREQPGNFNQAMMELGATVCLPNEPRCPECPVRSFCRTQGRQTPAGRKPRRPKRDVAYLLSRRNGTVLLVRRSATERLMPGMWELPQVELSDSDQQIFSLRHSITVTDFNVRVISRSESPPGTWTSNSRLRTLALTGLARKILRRAGIIQ
jgi:A/G-specific adenine glycosylase